MEGVFITATDTGAGKTVLAAGVLRLLQGSAKKKPIYWKPIQTGTIVGDDTVEVKRLTQLPEPYFWEPMYRFPEPLSPHLAAKKWGKEIEIQKISDFYRAHRSDHFVVIEGAGGVLVPLNGKELQVDLMKKLGLPLLIVTEDRVGAINHTLLTLQACKEAKIKVLGIILTKSRRTLGNAESIRTFGQTEILMEEDNIEDPKTAMALVAGDTRLREIFEIDLLPS